MNNVFFVSGIDTDCGKTFITGHLARLLSEVYEGGVITHKIIQTGCDDISEDIVEHRKIMNIDLQDVDINGETCPYRLTYPASPHLAANIDRVEINIPSIEKSIRELKEKYKFLFVEGAGGLMVPITRLYKTLDFIRDNNFPLLLVSSSKLGSINHTLLSLEVCKKYKIDLRAVVFNVFPEHDKTIAEDSYTIIQHELQKHYPNTAFFSSNELLNNKIDLKKALAIL